LPRSTVARVRVAEPRGDDWVVNEDVQAAIPRLLPHAAEWKPREVGPFRVPRQRSRSRRATRRSACASCRLRSRATGRSSRAGVILMPSYVNIGAWVGPNTMVDTWADSRVGRTDRRRRAPSRAGSAHRRRARAARARAAGDRRGRRLHRLAPAIVTEGVRIGREAVLAPNVSADRVGADHRRDRLRAGRAPRLRAAAPPIVVPGTRPKEFPAGTYQLGCALIIGMRTESTDKKDVAERRATRG